MRNNQLIIQAYKKTFFLSKNGSMPYNPESFQHAKTKSVAKIVPLRQVSEIF